MNDSYVIIIFGSNNHVNSVVGTFCSSTEANQYVENMKSTGVMDGRTVVQPITRRRGQ